MRSIAVRAEGQREGWETVPESWQRPNHVIWSLSVDPWGGGIVGDGVILSWRDGEWVHEDQIMESLK